MYGLWAFHLLPIYPIYVEFVLKKNKTKQNKAMKSLIFTHWEVLISMIWQESVSYLRDDLSYSKNKMKVEYSIQF